MDTFRLGDIMSTYKYSTKIEFETNGIYAKEKFLAFLKSSFGANNIAITDFQMTPPALHNPRERFARSYNAQVTLKKYRLDDEGTWNIYGEDPNCDMGGSHHEPFLETVEGPLSDVIDYAVNLKGFWQWGAGGRIEPAPAIRRLVPKQVSTSKAAHPRH
jgi:hypothetical protein